MLPTKSPSWLDLENQTERDCAGTPGGEFEGNSVFPREGPQETPQREEGRDEETLAGRQIDPGRGDANSRDRNEKGEKQINGSPDLLWAFSGHTSFEKRRLQHAMPGNRIYSTGETQPTSGAQNQEGNHVNEA